MQIDLRKISSKHSDAWKTQHGHAWQQEHLFKLTTNHTPSRSEFYSFVCHLRCGIARKIKYKIISATMIQSRMNCPCNTVIVDHVIDSFRTATNAAAPRHYFMITRCGNLDFRVDILHAISSFDKRMNERFTMHGRTSTPSLRTRRSLRKPFGDSFH